MFDNANPQHYMATSGSDTNWRTTVQGITLNGFMCPSDAFNSMPFVAPEGSGTWMRGNYAANAGPSWLNGTINGASNSGTSLSNTPDLNSSSSYNTFSGGMMGINYGAHLNQIPDGSSNTILLNEVRAGMVNIDRRGVWAMGLAGSSITAAHATGDSHTPNDNTDAKADDIEDCGSIMNAMGVAQSGNGLAPLGMGCSWDNGPNNWPNWQAEARSLHANGVNACFGDGSVRFVTNDVPENIWFCMNARNDGISYDPHYAD